MTNPTLFITVGISASGKSTFAKNLCSDYDRQDRKIVEINRDTIRFTNIDFNGTWDTYKFSKENESKVTEIANAMFNEATANNHDIIISDTNLNKKYRDLLVKKGQDHGYNVKIIDFPIDLEEALRRDSLRYNGVGYHIITQQYKAWLKYTGESDEYNAVRDSTIDQQILVNVDGLFENNNHEKHMLKSMIECYNERMIFISFNQSIDDVKEKLNEYFNLKHQLIVATGEHSFKTFIEMSRNGSTNVSTVIEFDPIKCHYWTGIGFNEVINFSG